MRTANQRIDHEVFLIFDFNRNPQIKNTYLSFTITITSRNAISSE